MENDLDKLQSQHADLMEHLSEREEIFRQLEEDTGFLKVQHCNSQEEVRLCSGVEGREGGEERERERERERECIIITVVRYK